eukprot:sb/3477932/
MGTEFEWPWQYSFPPFFTIQPIVKTKEQQLASWRNLICDYHQYHRKWEVDGAVFENGKISRRLSPAAQRVVLQDLCDQVMGSDLWSSRGFSDNHVENLLKIFWD